MATKKRYSDAELEEFRLLVNEKLAEARLSLNNVLDQLSNENNIGDDELNHNYDALEEGSAAQTKEDLMEFAYRQQKYVNSLEGALVRIENKTYGIDRITGELIPKERLLRVPNATLSVESKNSRK